MKNNITNFDAKKAFARHTEYKKIPQIYIDEYWDYYINLYNITDEWNDFVNFFYKEGFTYNSFKNELLSFISNGRKLINSLWGEQQEQNVNNLLQTAKPLIPKKNISELEEGKYISVDVHNAVDMILRYIGVFNDEYKSTLDIIKGCTKYEIFTKFKNLKMYLYNNSITDKQKILYLLYSNVLVEKLYQLNDETIQYLNNNFELWCKCGGDNFLYKLPENVDTSNILVEHICEDISYHIEILTIKNITMFGNKFKVIIKQDNSDEVINLYDNSSCISPLSLYPFAYKLSIGEELNEKDLSIGYEDEIFFQFDKSDIV